MRLMRHGLVGRLPRPANGDHARGAATMLQSAVVPTAAAPQSETMFVHSERWHNDQLGRSENFRSFRCVFRLLRAMCVDGTISIALVAQIVKTVQLTPAPRRGTKTRQSVSNIASSNGIIDISLPIEAKAATVDRGRINDASNACSASSRPASRRWSADVRFRRSIAAARQCRFSSRCCSYMSISFVVPRFDCVENGTWGMGGAQWKGDDFAILERHDASSGE